MKLVNAVIQSHKLEDVRDALAEIGVEAMTVFEVKRFGLQEEHMEFYRAAEYSIGFLPKTKLEFAVSDELADRAVDVLRNAATTGEVGDGRIFVSELTHVVKIRSGKIDASADAL